MYDEQDILRYRSLTSFQHRIMTEIAGLDTLACGLDIKDELDDYYDEDVNHGRLYPNLEDLIAAGFVEKGTLDKRTNSYELTEIGEQVLVDEHARDGEKVANVKQ